MWARVHILVDTKGTAIVTERSYVSFTCGRPLDIADLMATGVGLAFGEGPDEESADPWFWTMAAMNRGSLQRPR